MKSYHSKTQLLALIANTIWMETNSNVHFIDYLPKLTLTICCDITPFIKLYTSKLNEIGHMIHYYNVKIILPPCEGVETDTRYISLPLKSSSTFLAGCFFFFFVFAWFFYYVIPNSRSNLGVFLIYCSHCFIFYCGYYYLYLICLFRIIFSSFPHYLHHNTLLIWMISPNYELILSEPSITRVGELHYCG